MPGWFTSLLGPSLEGNEDATDFYECTGCEETFDEWPGYCPECGQLVVRIVERSTGRR